MKYLGYVAGGGSLPYSDVEDVAAHAGGDGHVPEPLPSHDNAGDQVGDGGASSQEGQPHHLQHGIPINQIFN